MPNFRNYACKNLAENCRELVSLCNTLCLALVDTEGKYGDENELICVIHSRSRIVYSVACDFIEWENSQASRVHLDSKMRQIRKVHQRVSL